MLEWLRNIQTLREQVLDPLTQEFASEECVPAFGHHSDRYLKRLQTIRSEINTTSYLLFREIMLITAQDVEQYYREDPAASGLCSVWDAWSGILHHIENKLEFTGNIFAMSGWRR